MFAIVYVVLIVAAVLATASAGSSYDFTVGNVTLYHAEIAYCGPGTYMTRSWPSYTKGFIPKMEILDDDKSTHGYIGIQPSIQAIVITFRGSEDIQNWITNLDALLTSYPLCSGCNVHKGFYDAEQQVLPLILPTIKSLKASYPSYQILVTGHSLGAALATLLAADLINVGLSPVKLFNYGSPRVGNTEFANWASKYLPSRTRSTHYKDMVVHSPMHERFTHISGEIYEDLSSGGPLKDCVGYEDETCSYQWHITSIDDHLLYQGLAMGSGGCAFMDSSA